MKQFRLLFTRRKDDLDDEIQAHLMMAIQDRKERGQSDEEAHAAAIREFGNIPLIKDVTHQMWGWNHLERLIQDLRYALRQLRRSPGFSITIIATLALGLGATTAMYTVVDRVLLRPLPYEDPGRLLDIKESGSKGVVDIGSAYLDIKQWRERSHTIETLAFYNSSSALGHLGYLEGTTGVTQVETPQISANLFAALEVYPIMGRGFAEESGSGAVRTEDARAVILSDSVWRNTFGSDPGIIGKTVNLNGDWDEVIGVMPRSFTFPFGGTSPMVWTPIVLSKEDGIRSGFNSSPRYSVIARLKPKASLASAKAELSAIQSVVSKGYTDPYERGQVTSVGVQRYGSSLVKDDLRTSLLALFGASGLLWLIACINATSLLLARATVRQREIAMRGALGASRARIVQQLVTESFILSGAASLIGLLLSVLTLQLFQHGLTTQFNIHTKLIPNLTVITVLLGLTVISALLSSVWPAVGVARNSLESALRQGNTQSGASRTQYRARTLLMIMEVAMSLTLLVGCGLLLRTMYALRHVPLGFRTDHVIVANMAIPAFKFNGKNMTTELYEPLLERVKQIPGIQSATLMTQVPLGKTFRINFSFQVEGKGASDLRKKELKAQLRVVGLDTQKVFGFTMWKGRFFNEGDTPTSQPVVIVNRAFAKEYTGDNQHPETILGESLLSFGKERRATVIGVLDDARQLSVAKQSEPEILVCLPQLTPASNFYQPTETMAMDLAVRTERKPDSVIPELRDLMRSTSAELSSSNFTTMDQVVEDSYGSQRLAARLLQIFAGTALLLSIAGIYGLLAYLVSQRTREMGLRIALGAQRRDVMLLVLRQAAWMLSIGSIVGLLLAYISSVLLKTFLYGVQVHDPWTMVFVTLLLVIGGMTAAYIPARRAASIDPMRALRTE